MPGEESSVTLSVASRDFGNGDIQKGTRLLSRLSSVLELNRSAWPVFAEGQYHALGKIDQEFDQFTKAILQSDGRERDIAINLIALLVRFINEEHLLESSRK